MLAAEMPLVLASAPTLVSRQWSKSEEPREHVCKKVGVDLVSVSEEFAVADPEAGRWTATVPSITIYMVFEGSPAFAITRPAGYVTHLISLTMEARISVGKEAKTE